VTDKGGTPEWADTVVKIPRIPKDGPMPTGEATPAIPVTTKDRPTLPAPPAVRTPPRDKSPKKAIPPIPDPPKAEPKPEPVKPIAESAPAVESPPTPVRAKKAALDDKTVQHPVTPLPRLIPAQPVSPATAKAVSPAVPESEATKPVIAVSPAPSKKGKRRSAPRRARLHISRIDPWSAMKITFMFSIAFGIMFFIAVWLSWTALESGGLFDQVNGMLNELLSNPSDPTTSFRIQDYVSSSKVLGFTALISVVNVVIMTALGTIAAFLYNLASTVIGGIEVTLTED
jgi:hypothetical protein